MPEQGPESSRYKPGTGGNDSTQEAGGKVGLIPGSELSQSQADPASKSTAGKMPHMTEMSAESEPSSEPVEPTGPAEGVPVSGDSPQDVPSATVSEALPAADEAMERSSADDAAQKNTPSAEEMSEEAPAFVPPPSVAEEGHEAEKLEKPEVSGDAGLPEVGLKGGDILKTVPAGLAAFSAGGATSSFEAQAEQVSHEGTAPPEGQPGETDLREESGENMPASDESMHEAGQIEQPATQSENLESEKIEPVDHETGNPVTANEGATPEERDQPPSSISISAENNIPPVRENAEPASPAAEQPESALSGLEEIVTGNGEEAEIREEVVDDLAHIIESIIFASDEPLSVATIKSVLDAAHTFGRVNPDMITARVTALNAKYEADGSGFYIVEIANGYQYATRREMAQWVSYLFKERSRRRLSNSALETVAIIAYKQPITKPEIESIRGVSVDYTLHSLLEKEIVTVVGRAESVGRPLLYGTTQKFLKIFALKNIEDLPKLREIEEIIKEIKSRGAEESIQLEITALGESSAPEPVPESEIKPEVKSENGAE